MSDMWIKPSEALPPLNKRVVVAKRKGKHIVYLVDYMYHIHDEYPNGKVLDEIRWSKGTLLDNVIAWMYIPELPK